MNIAIFASGNGSNAQRIIEHFRNNANISVKLIATNNPSAFVIARAATLKISSFVFSNKELRETTIVIEKLKDLKIDFIVLAGFLIRIPENLTKAYHGRIVNIHPALLPKYGGKGMYGQHVHEAVIAEGEKKSGITIHYVNDHYDEGGIIFQAECDVLPGDTPDSLATRIHNLEHCYYPEIIEKTIENYFLKRL